MQGMLQKGQPLQTEIANLSLDVQEQLGAGGQGEVYRVSMQGKDYALKWYYPASPIKPDDLRNLIRRGAPSDRFLWPLDLVHSSDSFGYVMNLRDKRFHELTDLMARKITPSFRVLCTVGFELAESFRLLHVAGLCYRDISWGNVFFDPTCGELQSGTLICDNDNVGVNNESISAVAGTPTFMAPEVVRGEAMPSADTDRYSLSLLLFSMFMLSHPLDGRREASIHAFDAKAMRWLYGDAPLFIFDPHDQSNAPVPGIHDNALVFWPIYPQFLRDLFTRAFTEGLVKPGTRIVEGEWRKTVVQLRDSIIYCSHCGKENFYDRNKLARGERHRCWNDQREIQLPMRLRVGDQVVMLNHDTRLYPHHLDPQRPYVFDQILGQVTRHPTDPNVWGLKNLAANTWVLTNPDGTNQQVPPSKNVTLRDGIRIHFGDVSGEVKA